MQCMEMAVPVLFPDTSFWAEMPEHKVLMTSLHWQTSLQTQKGHALTQLHKWLVNELGSLCGWHFSRFKH